MGAAGGPTSLPPSLRPPKAPESPLCSPPGARHPPGVQALPSPLGLEPPHGIGTGSPGTGKGGGKQPPARPVPPTPRGPPTSPSGAGPKLARSLPNFERAPGWTAPGAGAGAGPICAPGAGPVCAPGAGYAPGAGSRVHPGTGAAQPRGFHPLPAPLTGSSAPVSRPLRSAPCRAPSPQPRARLPGPARPLPEVRRCRGGAPGTCPSAPGWGGGHPAGAAPKRRGQNRGEGVELGGSESGAPPPSTGAMSARVLNTRGLLGVTGAEPGWPQRLGGLRTGCSLRC